ncbi:MAG: hypothetical protein ACLSIL_13465 [Enterococcus casseliflavus]
MKATTGVAGKTVKRLFLIYDKILVDCWIKSRSQVTAVKNGQTIVKFANNQGCHEIKAVAIGDEDSVTEPVVVLADGGAVPAAEICRSRKNWISQSLVRKPLVRGPFKM